jgi:hypothetical protein
MVSVIEPKMWPWPGVRVEAGLWDSAIDLS